MVKWASDYFIKAHVAPNKFYGQVGDGNIDHAYWGRPEEMTESRPVNSNKYFLYIPRVCINVVMQYVQLLRLFSSPLLIQVIMITMYFKYFQLCIFYFCIRFGFGGRDGRCTSCNFHCIFKSQCYIFGNLFSSCQRSLHFC